MIIRIKNYKIIVSPLAPMFYDLYKLQKQESGKGKGNIIEKTIAYGISLHRCIEIIAGDTQMINEEEVSLQEFVTKQEELLENFTIKIINQIKEKTNE